MADFTYTYGNFTHLSGEVVDCRFEREPHYTRRNRRDITKVRVSLKIMALGCTYTEILARELKIYEAYMFSGQGFAMRAPNGELTSVWLPASGVTPGNGEVIVPPKVISGPTLPSTAMEEGVVARTIEVVLESIWAEVESEIIHYEENISRLGNCGPAWVAQNTFSGPIGYQVWPATTQMIVQSGESIGFDGYYLAGAVPALGPAYEHMEQRVEELGKPIKFGPSSFLYYPAKWKYVFELNSPVVIWPQ